MEKENNMNDKTVLDSEKMTRRTFLKKSGAAILVLSWGGLTWRAFDQGVFSTASGPAYELWDMNNNDGKAEGMSLVRDAILASNPHNSQPWLFRVSDSAIELFTDESRNLGAIDPFRREMFIGLGCAIENLMLSAAFHGYSPGLAYFPNPLDDSCVAKIQLDSGEKESNDLYHAIENRHTHRGEYDLDRQIEAEKFREMETIVSDESKVKLTWFTSKEQKKQIGEWIVDATTAFTNDEELSAATNKWFQDDWKAMQKSRDGITLDAQGESFFIRAMGKILPPLSHQKNDQFWVAATRDRHTATAASYGLISIPKATDRIQKLRAGRAWQRIHLYGTIKEIGMHPLNQVNEMSDREKFLGNKSTFSEKLKQISDGDNGWEGVFLFRMGYPLSHTFPSPRRSVSEVIA